jgi:hypothetical protein
MRSRCLAVFCFLAGFNGVSAQRLTLRPPGDASRGLAEDSFRSNNAAETPADDAHPHSRPERTGTFVVSFAPYAHHTGKGNYNSRADFRALEWESPEQWSIGGASFRNSFAQPCWYAFGGRRFTLKHHSGRFFAKITAGVIYGYKSPHRDAVPLNCGGYSPAIIPSLGYRYKNVSFQLIVFGRAYGAMPMMGWELR